MRTIRLTIEYDGTNYSGWQEQANGISIQQTVEEAIERLTGSRYRLKSSGRTDAGVHARAMPAAFTTDSPLPLRAFIEGLNHFLPHDIAILDAVEVPAGFRPIGDALCKHYRYTIINRSARAPLSRLHAWHVRERLDLDAMTQAAGFFVGTHDFGAFRASNCTAKTSLRRIDATTVSRTGELVLIDVVGGGFLKNMVRVMAGTLVDVGRGRFTPGHVAWLLENPDRKKAGVTAPACGLCLISVTYPESSTFPPAAA